MRDFSDSSCVPSGSRSPIAQFKDDVMKKTCQWPALAFKDKHLQANFCPRTHALVSPLPFSLSIIRLGSACRSPHSTLDYHTHTSDSPSRISPPLSAYASPATPSLCPDNNHRVDPLPAYNYTLHRSPFDLCRSCSRRCGAPSSYQRPAARRAPAQPASRSAPPPTSAQCSCLIWRLEWS